MFSASRVGTRDSFYIKAKEINMHQLEYTLFDIILYNISVLFTY